MCAYGNVRRASPVKCDRALINHKKKYGAKILMEICSFMTELQNLVKSD